MHEIGGMNLNLVYRNETLINNNFIICSLFASKPVILIDFRKIYIRFSRISFINPGTQIPYTLSLNISIFGLS